MAATAKITVYVGTYTLRDPSVNGRANGIYIYQLDPTTGELTYSATRDGPGAVNPSWVTLSADQRYLYAINEITGAEGAHGTVSAFAIDPATRQLRYLNQQSSHGLAPCFVSTTPQNDYCLVTNYETGTLCVLPVQAGGELAEPSQVIQFSGSGPNRSRQAGPHAHMVTPGPDGRLIDAIDLGSDRIMHYRLDAAQGRLEPADPPWTAMSPGTGPRHIAYHPHRPIAYVISELQSTITVCRRNAETGGLAPVQTISTLPPAFSGQNLGAEIAVAPAGRFVYASNRGHNSLAIFSVAAESGELVLVGHVPTQGDGPRSFTIVPPGDLLLVANQESDTVVSLHIDQATGALAATGYVAQAPSPVCLQLFL